MTWKRFPHYWPFVKGLNHMFPVDFSKKNPVISNSVFSIVVNLGIMLNKQSINLWLQWMETMWQYMVIPDTQLVAHLQYCTQTRKWTCSLVLLFMDSSNRVQTDIDMHDMQNKLRWLCHMRFINTTNTQAEGENCHFNYFGTTNEW